MFLAFIQRRFKYLSYQGHKNKYAGSGAAKTPPPFPPSETRLRGPVADFLLLPLTFPPGRATWTPKYQYVFHGPYLFTPDELC